MALSGERACVGRYKPTPPLPPHSWLGRGRLNGDLKGTFLSPKGREIDKNCEGRSKCCYRRLRVYFYPVIWILKCQAWSCLMFPAVWQPAWRWVSSPPLLPLPFCESPSAMVMGGMETLEERRGRQNLLFGFQSRLTSS